ncbi:MAG: phosphate ABC transporter substrate-binding protein PstS [Alicyclobacillaceae bacterium]|nr:phosphate ABC transporter substrate-binding protein PstS [Alicyclobacillaceae bacterium]
MQMARRVWKPLGTLFLTAALLAGCGSGATPSDLAKGQGAGESNQGKIQLTGAGSTFDYPYFSKAFHEYSNHHPNVQVNYQSVGSGAGIQQFTQKTVDFGATDVPLNKDEYAKAKAAGGDVIQIPVALGGVAIAYNLPDVTQPLKLTPDVLTKIFLGKIKKWNDPAIQSLNPDAKLPATDITPVYRSDGSGTTYIMTDYLSNISPEWKSSVGTGKSVKWPVGVGAKGNEGVAGQIKQTPGAIGYVELAYVLETKMSYAALQNKAGKFVTPTLESVTAAASQFPNVSAENFSIVNAPGDGSYPIAGYSWVLLWKDQKDPNKGKALVDVMKYVVTDGQKLATSIQYAPLPQNVQDLAVQMLKQVQSGGQPLLQ